MVRERIRDVGVAGSNPVTPTIEILEYFSLIADLGSGFRLCWGPVGVQFRRKRITQNCGGSTKALHWSTPALPHLIFPAHEQIPSNRIRKTVIRLGANRRHRRFLELQRQ